MVQAASEKVDLFPALCELKSETSFRIDLLLQFGQTTSLIAELFRTSSSNDWPQSWHLNSYIGILEFTRGKTTIASHQSNSAKILPFKIDIFKAIS